MIRANANTAGIKSVTYDVNTKPETPKSAENYLLYRLLKNQPENQWTLLSNAISELEYLDNNWNTLEQGVYQYAVKVEYTGGHYSIAKLSDELIREATYTVTVVPNNPAWGSVTGGETHIPFGKEITIIATPNTDYEFVNWTISGGPVIATDSVYTFSVMENVDLIAHFRLIINVSEIEHADFTVFPNPVNDKLFIKSNGLNINTIRFFDGSGRIVKLFEHINDNEFLIDTNDLKSGFYFMNVDGTTVKVVKY
jgi:hypothetical protein